jgi:mRNA interferase MazF
MTRGEVWTMAGGSDFAGKPRPAVIVQDDRFDATNSVTICGFTSNEMDAPLFRLLVAPSERNGLRGPSRLMVDKITTVPRAKLGARIGRLDDEDMLRLNRAVVVFLGLAGPAPTG